MTLEWQNFSHDADIGVRGFGKTLAMAFENAAMALTNVITDIEKISPEQQVIVQCENKNEEILFVDWLNAIIYEMATHKMLFCRFDVTIENGKLTATIYGEKVNRIKHQPAVEIKGATFTCLEVNQNQKGWMVQTIVDV